MPGFWKENIRMGKEGKGGSGKRMGRKVQGGGEGRGGLSSYKGVPWDKGGILGYVLCIALLIVQN